MRYVARILLDATRPRPYPEWCCACEQCLFCMKKVYVRARKAATAWTHREKPMYFFTHKKRMVGARESNRGLLHPKQEILPLNLRRPPLRTPSATLAPAPYLCMCVFRQKSKDQKETSKDPTRICNRRCALCVLSCPIDRQKNGSADDDRQTDNTMHQKRPNARLPFRLDSACHLFLFQLSFGAQRMGARQGPPGEARLPLLRTRTAQALFFFVWPHTRRAPHQHQPAAKAQRKTAKIKKKGIKHSNLLWGFWAQAAISDQQRQ
ncbi:hypothetical protein TW95_gp1839 [Pandoravirus inopinatum]|uniref:4Fe-4S ferredoxin-type domain-containing protein n=1 Tax=Pandoravirus inopinatum TaxID=1605721 RepID=A0A0B5J033_9VIRU|nr:hypothetical protein TW95_gp1839 [Pandoravirus inopinatum]AJF98573.1 hypothetical protein [Pandoravirus inopinatum]